MEENQNAKKIIFVQVMTRTTTTISVEALESAVSRVCIAYTFRNERHKMPTMTPTYYGRNRKLIDKTEERETVKRN